MEFCLNILGRNWHGNETSYEYDPGKRLTMTVYPRDEEEQVENPFKYVGAFGVMDEGNGTYYMRARYYDPEVGTSGEAFS